MKAGTRERHEGLIALKALEIPITIIGVGSVGSFVALALAKMGCTNITIYDHDTVDVQNVGCQFYGESDIGKPKVEALAYYIKHHCDVDVVPKQQKWKTNSKDQSEIVICSVDTMEARNFIWDKVSEDTSVLWFIDTRMGGELMRIHTVSMTNDDSMMRYSKTLSVIPAPIACSERSIVYNAFIIGGLVTNQVKRIAASQSINGSLTFDIPTLSLIAGKFINQKNEGGE